RFIGPPGTLDGGDVLRIGKQIFVGMTARTNRDGIEQLQANVAPHGYAVTPVHVSGCLHLKSAVTQIGERPVLINPNWTNADAFADYEQIEVDPEEPSAANALLIGVNLIYPSAFLRTIRRLAWWSGVGVVLIDASELAKAEGGVTCCSVVFSRNSA